MGSVAISGPTSAIDRSLPVAGRRLLPRQVSPKLGHRLAPLSQEPDAAAGLHELALAYREFAWANPRAFELLFMNLPLDWRASVEDTARATAPVLTLAERLVGRQQALEAARLITAFANGFIGMELAGAFRLGGDIDETYRYGVNVLVDAITRDRTQGVDGDAPGST